MNSSARLHRTFTGRPEALARRAASTATVPACLPPNPPPVSGTMTRTRASGTPRASESSCRTPNGTCVPVQTVSRPWSPHSASATCVSRGTGAMYAVVYVAASVVGATARAASTSPTSRWKGPLQSSSSRTG